MSGPAPSSRTVGRWLKAERLRPWRYHNWQHIHDPEQFLARARPVLQLYLQARALLKQNIWLVCLDEKTRVQAREGEEPPRPAEVGGPQLQESRYERHGALNLFAALSVADGEVYGTLRDRKRFVDFQSFIEETIIPEALDRQMHTVKLVVDNGTTHAPKQLERWLEHLPVVQEGKLTFHVFWLPTNASWLDQIEIWFSILQRMCLQPNHFGSLQELKQAITDFIAYYNQQAQPIKWTYTSEKLEKKLAQRMNQETAPPPEQRIDQTIKTTLKQKQEGNSKGRLKQKRGQKRETNLREKKSRNVEIRADQNSARISA